MRGAAHLSHLWLFIRQEDVDSVKRLCVQDPLLLEQTDASGNSALQVASQVGCLPVLRSLLNQQLGKKLLNVGNKSNGMTPLMQAAASGHAKCAQLLLKRGASPEMEDNKGWNALHHAAFHGHEDVFADILKDRDPDTMRLDSALNLAASQRHLGVCQLLLSSCGTRLGLDDVKSNQDKEWLQGALGEQVQAHMNSKGAEKAMSRAATQAGYSEDEEEEEVIEDDGGESGEDELGQSLGATLERRPYERQSPNASWSAPTSPSPTAKDPPHGATAAATTQSRTFPPSQQHLSMPGQGVVHLPTGSRRAHPMYVRHEAREPYVPSMGPAPHARGTRSSLIGTGSLRNSLPILNTGRTAPPSAGPHSPARSSMSGSVSPVNGTIASVQSGSINMQRAPRGGPMRPVMSAQPRSAMYSAVPRGATRPYSTNTFRAPSPGLPYGPSLDAPLGSANGAGSNGWTLHAFSYRGMQEGLLLDRDTCLVYWMDPLAQLLRRAQQEAEDSKGEAAPPSAAVSPQAHLVGKLLPGVGGMDAPQYGRIAPVTIDDAATIELSKPAMRCLRQTSPAAALLHSCTRPSAPNAKLLADLVPGMGSNQVLVSATSLAVPLCAVLGILKVSELGSLTERDLILSEVDTDFLHALHELAASARGHDPTLATATNGRPLSGVSQAAKGYGRMMEEGKRESGSDVGRGEADAEALPSLSQLLASHGLLKLLPQAAERKLLSSLDVHRWHELASASSAVPLSRPELVRFRALLSAIRSVQDTALAVQSRRLELLLRLTVGSLVLYEADPVRAAQREERLLGVILEDLGPGVGASGKQYKVRDLLDDSISWMTLGQVRRVAPGEALGHLRADLLPPPTLGCPVTPLSAFPGQPVQVAMWAWTPPPEHPQTSADPLTGISPEPEEDARSRAVQQQVIGKLIQPVEGSGGLRWLVQWPDGSLRTHATGAKGAFELVHLQLHKLACAPLAHKHYGLLLCGQDMLCVPVVRSPLWARPSTDDTVPGSLGVGCLDASQTALTVMWSRSRANPPSLYSPDAQGQYPLCHGLLGGWPLTALNAKAGVVVEPGPGGMLSLQGVASAGPGTLVAPVRMASNGCGVVWRVKWASGAFTEHELGVELQEPELLVHDTNMATSNDNRVALLNEVTKRNAPTKSGAASMAANLGAANAVASLHKAPETAAAAAAAATGRLGRALFCKNAAQAARAGMLGALVKLNLGAMPLQPGCDQGPMAAHERTTLAAMMEARKAQNPLRNVPRDDVGIVVRDAGPGTWRGLMVRKLGSTEGFWYDEAVLLPATNSDIHKQVLRRGPGYMLPRHAQGVPVTDANAAPGMLVQRAYSAGAVLDGSEKATMLGELLRPAGAHMWEVQWRDGTVGVYKTGANNKFQLCFLNLHAVTGAPLLYSTVVNQAAIGATRMPVTDGPHCVAGGAEPGEVRYVLDPDTMQGLMQQEVSLLNAAGMVVTSTGERRSCRSMLRLYELSHAIVPGDALTIYTAKRGLHVALIEYNTEQREDNGEGTNGPSKGPVRLGVLQGPTRLAVQAVLDAGSGGGSGSKNGPTASRPSVLLMDPSRCYWEVMWENGRLEELAVGTQPSHTCLRVAPQRRDPTAEEEHEETHEDEEAEAAPKKVEQTEHFVRMVEPIMLLSTRDEVQDKKLVSLAKPLQRAIGWNNQLMRELCRVWWWSSRLAAAEREEQQKQAEPDGGPSECTQLWRPQLTLTPSQPDQLSLVLCAREPEMLRWTPLTEDKEGTVMNLVGMPLDEELAEAVGQLTMALAETPSELTPYGLHHSGVSMAMKGEEPQRSEYSSEMETAENHSSQAQPVQPPGQLHLVLQGPAGSTALRLAPNTLVDSAGSTWSAPPAVAEAIQRVNAALRAYRTCLAGAKKSEEEEQEEQDMATQYELQISLEPSMESGSKHGASHGLSAVLSIVRETPPALQGGKGAGSEPSACQGGTYTESRVTRYVGPAELLLTGEAPALQALLLSGHRALGALHSAAIAPSSSQQNPLQLAGDAAWCQWVDVPEHPMPQHLGPVRCMAAVNVQLYALRRICARLNGAAGLGSANIKHPLLAILKLVHAKARKGLAADAAERRITVAQKRSHEGREEVTDCLESQDIESFDWEGTNGILERVRAALASLATAELAGQEATVFAARAMVPILFEQPVVGASDKEDTPWQKSARALAQAMDATHRAYPEAAEAVKKAAIAVSKTMRTKVVQAEEAFMASSIAEEKSKEAAKDVPLAEQDLNTALEEIKDAKEAVSRAEENLKNAEKSLASHLDEEDKARQELKKADKAFAVASATATSEEASTSRALAEAYVAKLRKDLSKAEEIEKAKLDKARTTLASYQRAEEEVTQMLEGAQAEAAQKEAEGADKETKKDMAIEGLNASAPVEEASDLHTKAEAFVTKMQNDLFKAKEDQKAKLKKARTTLASYQRAEEEVKQMLEGAQAEAVQNKAARAGEKSKKDMAIAGLNASAPVEEASGLRAKAEAFVNKMETDLSKAKKDEEAQKAAEGADEKTKEGKANAVTSATSTSVEASESRALKAKLDKARTIQASYQRAEKEVTQMLEGAQAEAAQKEAVGADKKTKKDIAIAGFSASALVEEASDLRTKAEAYVAKLPDDLSEAEKIEEAKLDKARTILASYQRAEEEVQQVLKDAQAEAVQKEAARAGLKFKKDMAIARLSTSVPVEEASGLRTKAEAYVAKLQDHLSEAKEIKEEELQVARSNLASYQRAEEEAKQMLEDTSRGLLQIRRGAGRAVKSIFRQAVQRAADEKSKKDRANVVSSAPATLEEAPDLRAMAEAFVTKMQNDLSKDREEKKANLQNARNELAVYLDQEAEADRKLVDAQEALKAAERADEKTKENMAEAASEAKPPFIAASDKRASVENYRDEMQSKFDQATEKEEQAQIRAQESEKACNAKKADSEAASEEAKRKKQDARTLSPNAGQEKGGDTVEQQLARAHATTASVEAALHMLRELESNIPPSLRSPVAMARKLRTEISRITLVCAVTAAEWVRTACLPLDALVLEMEDQEQKFRKGNLRAQAQKAVEGGAAEEQDRMNRSNSQKSQPPAVTPPNSRALPYIAKLPSVPKVSTLIGHVHKDILSAYTSCHKLTLQIEPEASLEITDSQDSQDKLSCGVIFTSMGRSIQLAASALLKLAEAARDNARESAKSALEDANQGGGGKQAGGQSGGGGGAAGQGQQAPHAGGGGSATSTSPSNYVPASVQTELPNALKALRIAEMALGAAKVLPVAADIPITDTAAAKKLADTVKNAETVTKTAQRSVDDLVKSAVQALVKSPLGSASWQPCVKCAAYADLATESETKEETALWVKEAFKAWPEAREVADQAIKALVPPPLKEKPPTESADGEPKEEEDEKAKASQEAAAKEKAAAMAETERTINSYITSVSLKLALAAASWAEKSLETFNSSDVVEIERDTAEEVTKWHYRKQQDPHSPAGPHPTKVVESLHALYEPLQLTDQAARGAGNQLGLSKVDGDVEDAMAMVSGGVKQHVKFCKKGLNNALQELEELKKEADGGDEAAKKYADLKARMPDIAAGYAACAEDGLAGVTALQPLVSLVLLPEKVDREIGNAQQTATSLRKQVEQQGLAKRGAVTQSATSGGGSSERNLSMKLKVQLQLQEPLQEPSITKGRHAPPPDSSPRRLGTSAATIQAVPMKAAPSMPAYELNFCFEPEAEEGASAGSAQEEEEGTVKDLMDPARKVLQAGDVDTFLSPYRTLMAAANEAAAAAATADALTPSEDHMVSVAGGASSAGKASEDRAADAVQRYAATTNLSQLRRWAASVANMRSAAALVLQGFQEAAAAAAEELEPLTAPFDL